MDEKGPELTQCLINRDKCHNFWAMEVRRNQIFLIIKLHRKAAEIWVEKYKNRPIFR